MVPMGGDYQYSNAHKNFKNMDKLVKYVNQRVSTHNVPYTDYLDYLP